MRSRPDRGTSSSHSKRPLDGSGGTLWPTSVTRVSAAPGDVTSGRDWMLCNAGHGLYSRSGADRSKPRVQTDCHRDEQKLSYEVETGRQPPLLF